MSSTVAETVEIPAVDTEVDYARIAASAEFKSLRRRFLGFVVPMTVTYVVWYLLFVLLAMYAPAVMAIKVAGDLTFGLVMGALQFLSTFGLAAWYVRFANKTMDPAASAIRDAVGAGRLGASRPTGEPTPGPDAGPPPAERPGGHWRWEPSPDVVAPTRDRLRGGVA